MGNMCWLLVSLFTWTDSCFSKICLQAVINYGASWYVNCLFQLLLHVCSVDFHFWSMLNCLVEMSQRAKLELQVIYVCHTRTFECKLCSKREENIISRQNATPRVHISCIFRSVCWLRGLFSFLFFSWFWHLLGLMEFTAAFKFNLHVEISSQQRTSLSVL